MKENELAPEQVVEPLVASNATDGFAQMELPIAEAMRDADPVIGESSGACVGSGSVSTQARRLDFWSTSRDSGPTATVSYRAGGLTRPRTLQRKTWHRKNRGKPPPRKRPLKAWPKLRLKSWPRKNRWKLPPRTNWAKRPPPVPPLYASAQEAAPDAGPEARSQAENPN